MRIVGSMTTLPDRLPHIHTTIKSILRQSRPLDALYLHIPDKTMKGKPYVLPERFLEGMDVIVNRCGKDYGPITKLIPVLDLETDPDTKIITFDDDMYLHKDVVKKLEQGVKRHPNACLSFSGWCIGYFPFYMEYVFSNNKDAKVDWIQGTHSILYHRSMLNKKDILSTSDIPYVDTNDDHRMSYYLAKNNIDRIVLAGDTNKLFKNMDHSTITALSWRFMLIVELFSIWFAIRWKGVYTQTVSPIYSFSLYCIVILGIVISIFVFVPYITLKLSLFALFITILVSCYFYYRPCITLVKKKDLKARH